jgi:hypothetical protein
MLLGALIHQLWRHKLGLATCVAFASLCTLASLYHISVAPPGLQSRHLQIGAASTQVLVDAPRSKIVDLNAQTADFTALTTRADLLSNVMASAQVRALIAQRVGIPFSSLVATASLGTNLARTAFEPGSERRSTDLIKETDRWRIAVSVNATLPMMYIDAQAPTSGGAARLANAAVDALAEYLTTMSNRAGLTPDHRTRLVQFGRAQGGVVNPSAGIEIGLLTFLVTFGVACAVLRLLLRVRHGWSLAGRRERRDGKDWWLPRLETLPATVPSASISTPPPTAHEPG